MNKLQRAILTLLKYAFWTGVGAAVVAVTNNLGNLNLPDYVTPIVGAVLKAVATYAATEAKS